MEQVRTGSDKCASIRRSDPSNESNGLLPSTWKTKASTGEHEANVGKADAERDIQPRSGRYLSDLSDFFATDTVFFGQMSIATSQRALTLAQQAPKRATHSQVTVTLHGRLQVSFFTFHLLLSRFDGHR